MASDHDFVYAGRRLAGNGKTLHEWHLGDHELYFAKLPGQAIGGVYTVKAEISGDNVQIYTGTQRYSGQKISDVTQIAAWQAADQHARTAAAEAAAERRHAKSTELDTALADVLEIARRARTRADVTALTRVVSDKLLDAWRTR